MKRFLCLAHKPFAAIVDTVLRLVTNRDGNVALLFGLAAIPVVVGAGIAMDTTRAYMVKTRLGAALDAASLAVGSQTNQTSSALTTALNNYFFNNYCKTVPSGSSITACTSTGTVSGESSVSVSATTDITAATVSYSATATVPTTFMRLVGVNNLTVTVTAQTTKFPGMEIALVLDNTGSMLCGDAEQGSCGNGVVTGDSSCSNTNNGSRICTLRQAALSFVSVIQAAISGPQSIYISIVPYVTNVNVGPSFCTSATNCSHITATNGNFTDLRGYMMPVVPITGDTSSSSTTISNVAMLSPTGGTSTSGTAAIQPGMYIYGPGIPANATVSTVNSSSIVISATPTLTFTGQGLAVGPNYNLTSAVEVSATTNPIIIGSQITAQYNSSSFNVTNTSTTGLVAGMFVNSSSGGNNDLIPSTEDTVSSVTNSTTFVLSGTKPTTTRTSGQSLDVSNIKGTLNTSTSITSVSFRTGSGLTMASIVKGMGITGNGIPSGAYVTAVGASSITISSAATRSGQIALLLKTSGGTATSGSANITNVVWTSPAAGPTVGNIITGTGIPANTTITAVTGTLSTGNGTITMSQNATGTFNGELNSFKPLTYDSAFNSATPAGSSTSTGWGGCVVEPTTSIASGTGALAVAGNPDKSDPVSTTTWYPFYWTHDTANSWTTTGTAQTSSTEALGTESTSWLAKDGPNQGCPVPILPLTDLTTTAGQTAINNRINDMWARDSGGTQVPVGVIWGWRVLSSNGPFTANGGHPLSYSDAQAQGWKKIVVIMTDGQEEWPADNNMTGMGQIADGKLNTTSSSTAVTTIGSNLTTVCNAMLAHTTNGQKDFIIYTVSLVTNNTTLSACAGNTGQPYVATSVADLTNDFNDIAKRISHLRLTQ